MDMADPHIRTVRWTGLAAVCQPAGKACPSQIHPASATDQHPCPDALQGMPMKRPFRS